MSDSYRPGSGTEGMDFIGKWCGRCDCDRDDDCQILAATFALELSHPDYPTEWRYERGEPVCTAFVPEDEGVQPFMRSAAVGDLFGGYPRRPTQGETVRLLVGSPSGSA